MPTSTPVPTGITCAGDPIAERKSAGFSLPELLVVVFIIAILAGLFVPAIGRAGAGARAVECVSNLRQLQVAWQIYVNEHRGILPLNLASETSGVWRSSPDSWTGDSHAPGDAGPDRLRNGSLWRAGVLRSAGVFRCPDDRSRIVAARVPRNRSYSMNGNLAGRTNEAQRVVLHESEIESPSRVFVFIDEHKDSIDDGHFLVWSNPDDRWVNLPADRHGQAGAWSVADGHVERRRWLAPKDFARRLDYWKPAGDAADLADLRHLQGYCLPATNQSRQP